MFDDERALLVSQLTHVCRIFACLSFATKIRIVTCWIPSELNIADGPSRGLNSPSGCNNTSQSLSNIISPRENTSQLNSHITFKNIQPTPFKHLNRFRLNHRADLFTENQESLFYSSEASIDSQSFPASDKLHNTMILLELLFLTSVISLVGRGLPVVVFSASL